MPGVRKQTRNMTRVRLAYREACEHDDARCWLCGMPIDYTLRDNDASFELDHYFPVSLYPELQEDPAGFRPSHRRCNRTRGNKAPQPSLGATSRQWT